ncbi:hypothetical protein [Actinomadura atramentaria]|uniref:hypothetical protein n=1 Tax=Actinomadura atramentaria TaxID=1990 RepID=UPI000366EB5B|nr:hypothetical protein [Actinomadura atramentaria]
MLHIGGDEELRRDHFQDRGEGALPLVGILLLVAAVVVALMVVQPGGRLVSAAETAICRVLHAGGAADRCDEPAVPPVPLGRDPDQPVQACNAGYESHYLEETVTIPFRYADARTNSRGTLQITKRVGPDGVPFWEVGDFTWGELGAGEGIEKGGDIGFKAELWAGAQITNGNVYRFGSESEAREFYDDLLKHRIGNAAKFTFRTNPVTGGLAWLGGKLPWVGDDIDRWMGGSEPDRDPASSYTEGGLTGGFKGEGSLEAVKVPFKGRGWLTVGSQTDHRTGQQTDYFTRRGEAEVAVQIDFSAIWDRLPAGMRQRAAAGMDDALEAAMALVERTLRAKYGPEFHLDAGYRSQIKTQLKLRPSGGINYKHRGGTTYALTYDKNGDLIRMTKTENGQDVVYVRADGKFDGKNDVGDKAGATYGKQWILFGRRTITDKTLDLTDPDDLAALKRFFTGLDGDALDRYFQSGGGTMSRTVYDNDGDTGKLEGKGKAKGRKKDWGGVFELSEEDEKNVLRSAEYYKPGLGWIDWKPCR